MSHSDKDSAKDWPVKLSGPKKSDLSAQLRKAEKDFLQNREAMEALPEASIDIWEQGIRRTTANCLTYALNLLDYQSPEGPRPWYQIPGEIALRRDFQACTTERQEEFASLAARFDQARFNTERPEVFFNFVRTHLQRDGLVFTGVEPRLDAGGYPVALFYHVATRVEGCGQKASGHDYHVLAPRQLTTSLEPKLRWTFKHTESWDGLEGAVRIVSSEDGLFGAEDIAVYDRFGGYYYRPYNLDLTSGMSS